MNQTTQKKKPLQSFSNLSQINDVGEEENRDSQQEIFLESMDSDSYNLSYTCLLIPRFPAHQLKGDLADLLPQWLHQVCISYGWRVEFSNVHPDYLQWTIIVSPSTSPGRFMHYIRYELSKMIFYNFGRIRKENLSNDFWAPGYLVVLGIHPHPSEMIYQYIRTTRRQQGLRTL